MLLRYQRTSQQITACQDISRLYQGTSGHITTDQNVSSDISIISRQTHCNVGASAPPHWFLASSRAHQVTSSTRTVHAPMAHRHSVDHPLLSYTHNAHLKWGYQITRITQALPPTRAVNRTLYHIEESAPRYNGLQPCVRNDPQYFKVKGRCVCPVQPRFEPAKTAKT